MEYIITYIYDDSCYPAVLAVDKDEYNQRLKQYEETGEIHHVSFTEPPKTIKPKKIIFAKIEKQFENKHDH